MKLRKILAVVLVLTMCLGLFAACGKTQKGDNSNRTSQKDVPLVVGYSPFSQKFSPFFADTAYDQDVAGMTQVSLLTTDRVGGIIYNAIEGETVKYNGKDYKYTGIADVKVDQKDDGTVEYTFKIKEGVKFSDGVELTADDVIFSMYVLADPTYDGASTIYAAPIKGIEEYRSGMEQRGSVIFAAGDKGYQANDNYTEDQYNAFWKYYNEEAGAAFAKEICDYVIANGYNTAEDTVAACAANWGYKLKDDATYADFWDAIVAAYPTVEEAEATESAGSDRLGLTIASDAQFQVGVTTGESAAKISGIEKIDNYTVKVTTTSFDATTIYQLGISVTPLHYYGDKAAYDYANNKFGFTKGDLSKVKSLTTKPMGAGPYRFIKYENKVVYFEANENYYKGVPLTYYVQFKETQEGDKVSGVGQGTIDVTDPSFSKKAAAEIATYNSNKETTGDKVKTDLVANLGYGYIGINAKTVNVGGVPDSDASKALRKAFATIFSVYRDMAIDSYYGEAAEVINYPISTTSWAAPQKSDADYRVAYSKDAAGNDIYTADMDAEAKYAAAKTAALSFFQAAGYTVADGKVTAAPKGAKLTYEIIIPADGVGDHPTFAVLTAAKEAFAEIGINLIINDPSDSNVLWNAMDACTHEMWAAAWGATIDPDMYQVYYSKNVVGVEGSSESNHYHIQDKKLDEYIMEARTSADQAYRKTVYKACLDIILDWGVEVPVYQRQNCVIFSAERIQIDTVTPDITTFYGWLSEVENLQMVVAK